MDELAKTGRLKNARKQKEGARNQQGQTVFENGHAAFVVWISTTRYLVSSERIQDTKYQVDTVAATCECPSSNREGKFKFFF